MTVKIKMIAARLYGTNVQAKNRNIHMDWTAVYIEGHDQIRSLWKISFYDNPFLSKQNAVIFLNEAVSIGKLGRMSVKFV